DDKDDTSTKTPTLEKYFFNCSSGEVQIKASYSENPLYDLEITLLGNKKYTDNNGVASFIISSNGHYTFVSEATGTYNSRSLTLYNLILCPEQTEEETTEEELEEEEVIEEQEEDEEQIEDEQEEPEEIDIDEPSIPDKPPKEESEESFNLIWLIIPMFVILGIIYYLKNKKN
ncbi:MAG: hypothetical protein PHU63_04415, partial [Candidatus ainarchaeum sp.]|nr:hypothetical protein [Candidatus ainarchaeum sp.]